MARKILASLLEQLILDGGSDLHLRSGKQPRIRVDGNLRTLDHPPLQPSLIHDLADIILGASPKNRLGMKGETDLSFQFGGRRFRVNFFYQLSNPAMALRLIPETVGTFRELGIPKVVETLCQCPHGLVLVAGPSGAGKTTTLAAMLESINLRQHRHILTIEDPVEFLHRDKKSLITHREINTDTSSFQKAVRMALREDPDVVLVGEMRDLETVEAVLQLAETGHLTFSTVHTNSAFSTLHRIIGCFDGNRQNQIRSQLAMVLQGVICQQLIPRRQGRGQVLATEILIPDPAIRHLIRENRVYQIYSMMQTGRKKGMQTMNQSLVTLYSNGHIGNEDCVSRSPDPQELLQLLRSAEEARGPDSRRVSP